MKEKVASEKEPMHLGPNLDLHLLRQVVVFELEAAGVKFNADSARALVRCLQKGRQSSLESMVGTVGSTIALIAESLVWEGLDEGGTPDPAIGNKKRKNGEPLLDLKDRLLLALFA